MIDHCRPITRCSRVTWNFSPPRCQGGLDVGITAFFLALLASWRWIFEVSLLSTPGHRVLLVLKKANRQPVAMIWFYS
jgi:hypothetical protein